MFIGSLLLDLTNRSRDRIGIWNSEEGKVVGA